MTTPEIIIKRATGHQNNASRPRVSAFVSAHAGSGKTHVLVNRVIRLMLAGAPPEKILCLTYTRAAAAEMKTRLFERLARWVEMDDQALIREIARETGHHMRYEEFELAAPRTLFARALETPGGLKVQTIHAFCERLLHSFPVEAGLSPGFEMIDEALSGELLAAAQRRVLAGNAGEDGKEEGDEKAEKAAKAGEDDGGKLAEHVSLLSAHLGEKQLSSLLSAVLARRKSLVRLMHGPGWRQRLAARLGADPETADEQLFERWFAEIDRELLAAVIEHLADYPGDYNDAQARAYEELARATTAADAWELSRKAFFTKNGTPRADSSTIGKKAARAAPELARRLLDMRDSFSRHHDQLLANRMWRANVALFEVAHAVIALYQEDKKRRGLVDYDDLIERTLELLEGHSSAWVLYRLDAGVDHVLVDEAQDTSPEQWRIIRLLTEEFHAGEGSHADGPPRTVFAVGDFKQSIYSFQGADPQSFLDTRDWLAERFRQAGVEFENVEMDTSFRTVPAILEMVDKVASGLDLGFAAEGELKHQTARPGDPGFVELWPLEEAPGKRRNGDIWSAPRQLHDPEAARLRLSRKIAATIRRWLDEGRAIPGEDGHPRPMTPGDILILLRKRTTFMDAMISELKRHGIPVAGADRLEVGSHIAVRDMLALGRFLANREDDLSLACVLKSPLLARDDGKPFTDDDLMALRMEDVKNRRDISLWRQLRRAAKKNEQPYGRAVETLQRWWAMAGFHAPYELFARILGRDGGMRAFLSRLGAEAAEPLEAFLDLARQHERLQPPSLGGFLAYMEAINPELKRDMEAAAGEVRVMTVHGAKGLEANIVFLPDTCDGAASSHESLIIAPPDERAGEGEMPLWIMSSKHQPASLGKIIDEWKARQRHEHNRLLYVAMTRARDRLYVAGALTGNRKKPHPQSWYEAMSRHMKSDEFAITGPDGETICWRYPPDGKETAVAAARDKTAAPAAPPEWLRRPPAA